MGSQLSCCGSHASKEARKSKPRKREHRLVLKLLAEVNTLSSDDGPLRWQPCFHSLVPLSLHCVEQGDVYVYRVTATGVDGTTFSADISIPGTKIRKTAECFIQWRDNEKGGAWGLNFMSESEALKFLEECSPPTLTPESGRLRHALSSLSLSLPIPDPPCAQDVHLPEFENVAESHSHSQNDGLDSIILKASSPQNENATHRTLNTATPDAPDDTPPSSPVATSSSSLPAPNISYESLLDLHHVSPDTAPRYSPPPEFFDADVTAMADTAPQEERMLVDVQTEIASLSKASEGLGSCGQSPESSILDSDFSDGIVAGSDEDLPRLFEPSSPIHIGGKHILPDIMEENEPEESESEFDRSLNLAGQQLRGCSQGEEGRVPTGGANEPKQAGRVQDGDFDNAQVNIHEEEELLGGLEYVETNFSDNLEVVHVEKNVPTAKGKSSTSTAPPSLPVSPPPGPMLSPRFSLILGEGPIPELEITECHTEDAPSSSTLNRFSTISIADDVPPPPLPSSLPPGKLISPRHSMIENQGTVFGGLGLAVGDSGRGGLDMSSLVAHMDSLIQERELERADMGMETPEGVQNVEEEVKKAEEQNVTQVEDTSGVENADMLPLPPPLINADEETPFKGSKLKVTPSFLRNLEPPVEFSDSGFPETDTENTPGSTHKVGSDRKTLSLADRGPCSEDVGSGESVPTLPLRKNSFVTSDERLTEYSGSVGLKTTASSGSLPSLTTGSHDDESVGAETAKDGGKEEYTMPPQPVKPSIRKTGWLEVKTMLVRKNKRVAMASKRKWKKHWATQKGSNLLLYQCDDATSLREGAHPDLRIDLEMSLAHAVHDHVKRDHIFCLSTSNGNTYYLQSTSQSEVEDWIAVIHCAAAIEMTKQANKEEAVRTLKSKVDPLNQQIEKECQLKNLTELNLTAAADYATRSLAAKQLVACAENIERYHVELYRIRCYTASLHGTELPNPQSLLGCVSRPTKVALGRVGIFTVASLHAMVSARQGSSTGVTGSSGGHGRKRTSALSPTKGKPPRGKAELSTARPVTPERSKRSLEISGPYPISHLPLLSALQRPSCDDLDAETTDADESTCLEVPAGMRVWPAGFVSMVHVRMPNTQSVQLPLRNDMTIGDVLINSCEKIQLNPRDHFVRLRLEGQEEDFECDVPSPEEFLVDLRYSHVEVCQKVIHTVVLSPPNLEGEERVEDEAGRKLGLILEPVWDSSDTRMVSVLVRRVQEGGVADTLGVSEGDEVVLVNDSSVIELGWAGVTMAIEAPPVSLTLRTCHIEMPVSGVGSSRIVEGLICPAPPSHSEISEETLGRLIVPMPSMEDLTRLPEENSVDEFPELTKDQIDVLLKDSHELSKLLRTWKGQQLEGDSSPWTSEDRLRKSAQDLVETEQEYVRLLDMLIERYLEPLKSENHIPPEEMEIVSGNIVEIVEIQKKFLKSLEDAFQMEVQSAGESSLRHMVYGLAGTFLCYADHFRTYSTFCTGHHKAKEIIARQDNISLQQFLEVRNPKRDPSLNFDALMAKPIVRVSRYPLYLNAMMDQTQRDSHERVHLQDAIDGMMKVADHINEMQRISEMYSSLFQSLLKDSGLAEFGVNVGISQLKYYGQVLWLNPMEDQLAKGWKKGQGPTTLCFVFNSALVLLCVDKKFKRKESKVVIESPVTAEDVKYKALLPCVQCGVHNLPDSDGVTNMWQVLYKSTPGSSPINYLLRSQSVEQKSTMVHLVRQSIQEQQRLYGSPSGRDTPTSTHSFVTSRSLPSLTIPQAHFSHQSSSPSLSHQLHRVTSPTPSYFPTATGYYTPSDTDHD